MKPETQDITDKQIATAAKFRREKISETWNLQDTIVIIPAGLEVPLPGGDMSHPYYAHPNHYYLVGNAEPGRVLVYDPKEGWILFTNVYDEAMKVWTGPGAQPKKIAELTGIENTKPLEKLASWLETKLEKPFAIIGNQDIVTRPTEYGIEDESSTQVKLQKINNQISDPVNRTLEQQRSIKDSVEVTLIKNSIAITQQAFEAVLKAGSFIGKTVGYIRKLMLAQLLLHGADRGAYPVIVGAGPDGAVLHPTDYPYRTQDDYIIQEEDVIMIDAGADSRGMPADVTRVFPANQEFTPQQKRLYETLLEIQEQAINDLALEKEFLEVHWNTNYRVTEKLIELGFLKGDANARLEDGSAELFTRHGLGHMLGTHVHDMQRFVERETQLASERAGARKMKVNFKLRAGQVFTVEPGIYFPTWELTDPAIRKKYKDTINWKLVDNEILTGKWGYGMRIEDDIHMTEEGPEILTAKIPKELSTVLEQRN